MTVPDQVAERVRKVAPRGCSVLAGSLPVVSFGDFRTARVATLALNPSPLEFLDRRGHWLDGPHRRLASLRSIGVDDPRELDDAAVAEVVRESNAYFDGPNWYRSWFHWLEALITRAGLGSYVEATACHLDLVQWATRPAQRHLSHGTWRALVDQDQDFLSWQLRQTPAPTVLVNGAGCLRGLTAAGVVPAWEADELRFSTAAGAPAVLQVFTAEASGKRFLGWNRPLAGAIPAEGRALLRDWVTATASR